MLYQLFSTVLNLRYPSMDSRHPSIVSVTWVTANFKIKFTYYSAYCLAERLRSEGGGSSRTRLGWACTDLLISSQPAYLLTPHDTLQRITGRPSVIDLVENHRATQLHIPRKVLKLPPKFKHAAGHLQLNRNINMLSVSQVLIYFAESMPW